MEQLSLPFDTPGSPTPTPPARSPEQRMEALQKGNTYRLERANICRSWRSRWRAYPSDARPAIGDSVIALIMNPPDWAQSWRVEAFLNRVPSWGPKRTNRVLQRTMISLKKTLGGLTQRQRIQLAEEVRKWQGGEW